MADQVGENREWPLRLDVFIEHVVEDVVNSNRQGSKGPINGPFYMPGSPTFDGEGTLPMREGPRRGNSLMG